MWELCEDFWFEGGGGDVFAVGGDVEGGGEDCEEEQAQDGNFDHDIS